MEQRESEQERIQRHRQKRKAGKIKEANRRRNKITLTLVIIVMFCLSGSLLFQTYGLNKQKAKIQVKYETLESQYIKESEKSEDLQKKKNYVLSDEYIESEARDKLGLVNKDELVIKPSQN